MSEKFIIYGPAGTGKTTTIQSLVRRCIDQYGAESIMLASFTTNAAQELRRSDVTGEPLPLQPHQIGTLHSHCYHALCKPELAEKHIPEWNESHDGFTLSGALKKRSLDEPDDGTNSDEDLSNASGDDLMREYQIYRAKLTPREEWPERVTYFAEQWEAWKTAHDYLDFTDLIDRAADFIDRPPHGARILIVDEAQDCPPNQLRLIETWGKNCDFFVLAGDDDQCLYAHTGASPLALMDDNVPDDHKRFLDQSYRIPQLVQVVAQTWIETVETRVPKTYQPRNELGMIRTLRSRYREPSRLIEDVEEQVSAGRQVMILAACSYMLTPVLAELRKHGLPFHNPLRRKRGDWNPMRAARGTSMSERILSFKRPDNDVWGTKARIWTARDLEDWTDLLNVATKTKPGALVHGAKARIEAWREQADAQHHWPELAIPDLLNLFTSEAHLSAALDGDLDWLEAHAMAKHQNTLSYPLQVARQRGTAALLQTPQIVIGTIHSVKGGQSEVVYLFPDLSAEAMKSWKRGGAESDAVIRQFYVAITRTKEELVVCQPSSSFAVQLPLYAAAEKMVA